MMDTSTALQPAVLSFNRLTDIARVLLVVLRAEDDVNVARAAGDFLDLPDPALAGEQLFERGQTRLGTIV